MPDEPVTTYEAEADYLGTLPDPAPSTDAELQEGFELKYG